MKVTIHSFFAEKKQNQTHSFLFGLQAALPDNNGEVLSFSKSFIAFKTRSIDFVFAILDFFSGMMTLSWRQSKVSCVQSKMSWRQILVSWKQSKMSWGQIPLSWRQCQLSWRQIQLSWRQSKVSWQQIGCHGGKV